MEKVEITSTSKRSAIGTDIVLRDLERVRLCFRPEMVDNQAEPQACIKGRFLYQKKGKDDNWADFDTVSLNSLKKGEGYELELKSGELRNLLRNLAPLYRLHMREGMPQGRVELYKLDPELADLLSLTEQDLSSMLTEQGSQAGLTLQRVLKWLSKQTDAKDVILRGEELPDLNLLVGLANLRSVLDTWQTNRNNSKEEFWQKLFSQHSYVLSQLFAYPIVLINAKAYLGGKEVSNSGGNIVDFLCRTESTGAAVLIEIKTPLTSLLGVEYRGGVYGASADLSGSISQVLEYRETLVNNFHSLRSESMQLKQLTAAEPYCLVIIGSSERELVTEAKKRAFERFRERLVGVRVVTFDEVFRRIEGLVGLLEQSRSG